MGFWLPDWKSFLFVMGSLVLMYFEKISGGLSLEYDDISLNVVFKIKNAIGFFFLLQSHLLNIGYHCCQVHEEPPCWCETCYGSHLHPERD